MGARKVIPEVWAHLEDADSGIPDAVRPFLAEACEEVRDMERRIAMIERQLEALAEQTPAIQRLLTVPGIGLLTDPAGSSRTTAASGAGNCSGRTQPRSPPTAAVEASEY